MSSHTQGEPTRSGEPRAVDKRATNPRLNPAIAVEMSMRERDALMDSDDWSLLLDKVLMEGAQP